MNTYYGIKGRLYDLKELIQDLNTVELRPDRKELIFRLLQEEITRCKTELNERKELNELYR